MYNDFVLIGPKSDPAGVKGKDIETALKTIQAKAAPFVSRGDRSGTHAAELALWKQAGIDIAAAKGAWYREIGQGMGAALNTASAMNAYVLSDRGTWISFKNRGDLEIVVEGDKRLFNQYGVMLVNPEKYPTVKKELGQTFVDWLISPEGQATIAGYKIDGQQLFFPDAGRGVERASSLSSSRLALARARLAGTTEEMVAAIGSIERHAAVQARWSGRSCSRCRAASAPLARLRRAGPCVRAGFAAPDRRGRASCRFRSARAPPR